MTKVVKLLCLKVRSALLDFEKTKSVPGILLSGDITISDIQSCIAQFDQKEQKKLKKIITLYKEYCKINLENFKKNLRKEYSNIIFNLHTQHSQFRFSEISSKYRDDMNPVSAFCYELQYISGHLNPDNLYHAWLIDLAADEQFSKNIISAVKRDIYDLQIIIDKYKLLFELDDKIPLDLFHAKQKIKDFEFCLTQLSKFRPNWDYQK